MYNNENIQYWKDLHGLPCEGKDIIRYIEEWDLLNVPQGFEDQDLRFFLVGDKELLQIEQINSYIAYVAPAVIPPYIRKKVGSIYGVPVFRGKI